MALNNKYVELNKFYYKCLKYIKEDTTGKYLEFLTECNKKGITDLEHILYKKLIDDSEEVSVNGKNYELLPMGLIRDGVPLKFLSEDLDTSGYNFSVNNLRDTFIRNKKFVSFYYPNDSKTFEESSLNEICSSYINHYSNSLGEKWSKDDFFNMINSLKYLSIKYAKDTNTNQIFAVGFFGASVREGAGGKALTNAELFVMPEFRNLGIAKKMVALSFEQAKMDGITNFDSITYRVQNHDALSFWEGVGATVSGLIHIEGDLNNIISIIEEKSINKQKQR